MVLLTLIVLTPRMAVIMTSELGVDTCRHVNTVPPAAEYKITDRVYLVSAERIVTYGFDAQGRAMLGTHTASYCSPTRGEFIIHRIIVLLRVETHTATSS
ncbi:hypothetical protein EV401DRAFT_1971915 [Pisolithus croceorrhizus]|nr:hypothetical protein EV401DRAFT_1971915 [Pisolithus croceorrhizus]